ncbi:MAG: hypothetical protein FRX49_13498 [Trebouxia sp. A1-2]|nr:MAG: hypothetical protein FRX49_13498 [Trebouxia sp. A1-2]
MKPLLRSTVLMGLSPAPGAWPSRAALDDTGSHLSTISPSVPADIRGESWSLQACGMPDRAIKVNVAGTDT